jgi:Leucine-rich repeat (LRR) protein
MLFSEEELEEEILAAKRKIRYEEIKARNEHLLHGDLDLTEFRSLQKLQLTNQELASINVKKLSSLKKIVCSNNQITDLNKEKC